MATTVRTKLISFVIGICFCISTHAQQEKPENRLPVGSIRPIPKYIQRLMRRYSWHRGCPVALSQLRYLRIHYYGFDHHIHIGHLIVHARLAKQVYFIFQQLRTHHFPIQRMQPMYRFKGQDRASMAANNTAGFNCRRITGNPRKFSKHSYGCAIDINPRQNPYVNPRTGLILPKDGKRYLQRSSKIGGQIRRGNRIYRLFVQHRWYWGGNWRKIHDYQHFETRLPAATLSRR